MNELPTSLDLDESSTKCIQDAVEKAYVSKFSGDQIKYAERNCRKDTCEPLKSSSDA